jgi:signal transduction histidine kinase
MSLRVRSVRTKILLLTLVPMLSLFGLYLFATSITAQDAINLARASSLKTATGEPIGGFLAQIDVERPLVMVYLSAPTAANLTALRMQGQKTDHAAQAMRAALLSSPTMDNASGTEKQAIAVLLKDVSNMAGLRAEVGARVISKTPAFTSYNNVVTDAYQVLNLAIHEETNAQIVTQGLAFVRMGRSEDLLLREDALLEGDFAARSFPPADRQQFAELAGARRTLFSLTLDELDPAYRVYYNRNINAQTSSALAGLEDTVIGYTRPGLPPINPLDWQRSVQTVSAGLSAAGNQAAAVLTKQASHVAFTTNLRLALAGGAGLLAVIVSILVAIFTSRSLVRELRTLRRSALELANERLPRVVASLADGRAIEMPKQELDIPAKSHEIEQVRDAFAKVQQTAVEAAVGQARLREGISDVFRNLARRSQSLLHRQLTLLDGMERRAADPEQLADLFRIDHLTTRMRRHAESLIILSGQAPARGWRNPVPLVDVLRAAVAEVEDYTRIKVIATTKSSLSGPAVADVIHLLAELAENATVFSPPNTPVLITGDLVGRGFAVEIEDRGLGLSEEKVTEINERLADPPPFDPSGTDQLGLFVASQLAKRHDIRIRLRESPYGGTTAIVLIPHVLVIPDETREQQLPPATTGGLVSTGRHASKDELPSDSNGFEPAGWMAGRTLGGGFAADSLDSGLPPAPVPPQAGASAWDSHTWDTTPAWEPPTIGATVDAAADDTGPVPVSDLPQRNGGEGGDGDSDSDSLGLPRRVRQASLAPQLRTTAARFTPPASAELLAGGSLPVADPGAQPHAAPTPDQTRATLSAIQRGWQRGRSMFDPPGSGEDAGSNGVPPPPAAGGGPAARTFSDAGTFGGVSPFGRQGGLRAVDDTAESITGTGEPPANGLAAAAEPGAADVLPEAGFTGPGEAADVTEPATADRLAYPGEAAAGENAAVTDHGDPAAQADAGEHTDALATSGQNEGTAAAGEGTVHDGETGSDGGGLSGWS